MLSTINLKNFLFAAIAVSTLFLWVQSGAGSQISNDALMTTISAYPVEADNDYVIAFNAKALESCSEVSLWSGCEDYHSLTIMGSAYNYLLFDLLFPQFMTVEDGEAFFPPYMHALHFGKIFSSAFAFAVLVVVTGYFRERINIYLLSACLFALLFKFLPPLLDGAEGYTRALMVLGVLTASAGWFGARFVPRYGESPGMSTTAMAMGGVFLLAIITLRMNPEIARLGYLLGSFTAGMFLNLCLGKNLKNYSALVVFGLLFFLISAYAPNIIFYSWGGSILTALPFMALAIVLAVSPKSRWVWVILTAPLFHVGGATLSSMTLAFSEGVVCLFRRKISRLLVASVLTAIAGLSFSYLLFTNKVPRGFSIEAYMAIAQTLGFAYAVVMFVLFCGLGIFLLRQKNRALENAALASFLLGILEFSNGVFHAVLQAGFSGFEDNIFGLAYAYKYISIATPGMMFILLVASLYECLKSQTCENKPAPNHVPHYVLAVTVFLLAASAGQNLRVQPGKLADLSKEIAGDVSGYGAEHYIPFVNMKYDDSYPVLYGSEQHGDSLKYFSMLKLSMRIRGGLVDPEKFEVYHIQVDARP